MWSIKAISNTVAQLRVERVEHKDWEFRILVTTDRHVDSVFSDVKMQIKHLEEAKKNNWPVIDCGDLFDAMDGKFDPRRSRLAGKIEDKDEYFDALVEYAESFLSPYSSQIALMGVGNHELSVLKNNETHLTKRVARRLGGDIVVGGFSGWLKVHFSNHNGKRQTINIRYTHGAGGDSPVSKGVLKAPRRGLIFPDAHILLSGHTHETWIFPIARERISGMGVVRVDEQLHISVPSYKDEVIGQTHGYAVGKELPTKTKGAVWLRFFYDPNTRRVDYDVERTK